MKIFTTSTSRTLALKICEVLSVELSILSCERFRNGEIKIQLEENVENENVVFVNSCVLNPTERIFETFLFADAARRAGSLKITLVMPYFGYSRQDRILKQGEPISAKVVAKLLETVGISKIISIDIHAECIMGYFDIPVVNLSFVDEILVPNFEELYGKYKKNLVIVSPDIGGVKRARKLADVVDLPFIVTEKERKSSDVSLRNIYGDVEKKDCLIIDDIIDSGNSIKQCINALKKRGANKIELASSHFLGDKNIYSELLTMSERILSISEDKIEIKLAKKIATLVS